MLKDSATNFRRNIGRDQEITLRTPVAVTRNGRGSCELISTGDYRRLKLRDREVLELDDFSDEEIAALELARPPEEFAVFDDELNE